jgi:hypothetical protein
MNKPSNSLQRLPHVGPSIKKVSLVQGTVRKTKYNSPFLAGVLTVHLINYDRGMSGEYTRQEVATLVLLKAGLTCISSALVL